MYSVRIWKNIYDKDTCRWHYEVSDEQKFSTFDKAWEEQCRLMNQGMMCDTIRSW